MAYERFDVVVVPFPFTDQNRTKRRPALVISNRDFNSKAGHSVMAMITSAGNPAWPSDITIVDVDAAGLPAPSVCRMKLFTLDNRLILRQCGSLGDQDRKNAARELGFVIGDSGVAHSSG